VVNAHRADRGEEDVATGAARTSAEVLGEVGRDQIAALAPELDPGVAENRPPKPITATNR